MALLSTSWILQYAHFHWLPGSVPGRQVMILTRGLDFDWTLDFDSSTLVFITSNISNIDISICPGSIPRNPIKILKSIQTIASLAVELNWQTF